jgi:hypothetical protein
VCSQGTCRCPPGYSGKYCQKSDSPKVKEEPVAPAPKEEKEPIDLELGKYLKILIILIILLVVIAIAVCLYVNRSNASRADWLGYRRKIPIAMTDGTKQRHWEHDHDKMTEAVVPDDVRP